MYFNSLNEVNKYDLLCFPYQHVFLSAKYIRYLNYCTKKVKELNILNIKNKIKNIFLSTFGSCSLI